MSLPFTMSTLVRGMRPSPIREHFPLVRRPEMISSVEGCRRLAHALTE
jgi:hypothetical protein